MLSLSATGLSSRLKITSIACGILILVLRALYVVNMMWLRPFGTWYFASWAIAVGVPFGIWYVVGRPELRRRANFGLDADRTRFVIGISPGRTARGLSMFVYASLPLIVERVPNTDRVRLSTVPGILPYWAAIFSFAVVSGLGLILVERPRLELDPDGMTLVRFPTRRKRIAWDEITPWSPTLQLGSRSRYQLSWRPAGSGRPSVTSLPVSALHVDRVFLLHAVRVYVDQPERRAEIGTQAGLDRLQRERSDALAAAGLVTAQ